MILLGPLSPFRRISTRRNKKLDKETILPGRAHPLCLRRLFVSQELDTMVDLVPAILAPEGVAASEAR